MEHFLIDNDIIRDLTAWDKAALIWSIKVRRQLFQSIS